MLSHLFLSTNHDTINFFPSFYIIKTTPQSIIAQKYFMQLFKKYYLFVKFRLVLSSPYYMCPCNNHPYNQVDTHILIITLYLLKEIAVS